MSNTSSTNASSWPPWPPSNETAEDREKRLQEEANKKRHSDNIDHDINLDREQRVATSSSTTKILLLGKCISILRCNTIHIPCFLGQAESGKSTVLKNFHLLFAPRAFQAKVDVNYPPNNHNSDVHTHRQYYGVLLFNLIFSDP